MRTQAPPDEDEHNVYVKTGIRRAGMTLSRTSRAARKIVAAVWSASMLGVTSCSAGDNAISLEETRKLGGSTKAEQAKQKAEKHLVAIAHTYDKETPLTLALVTVKDYCASGSGGALPSGDDTYKIRCTVDVTGYYGADRDRIGDVMDGVLSAGDRQTSATTPGGLTPTGDKRRKFSVGVVISSGKPEHPRSDLPCRRQSPRHFPVGAGNYWADLPVRICPDRRRGGPF
jgi:hypothetical protein